MATTFKNVLQNNISPVLSATSVASATPSAGSVTISFATQTTIPFQVGSYITVAGVSVAGYNGTYQVTAATVSSVRYTNATTGAATGGTITPTLLVSNASAKTTVIGLSLTNITSNVVLATVQLQDTVALTSAYYAKDIVIPASQSLRVVSAGEKLILGPSTNVLVSCSTSASVDAIISYVEIS
jgi:hypothetical protein